MGYENPLRNARRIASALSFLSLTFLRPYAPIATPDAYPYPPWVVAVLGLWPLFLLIPFLLALWTSDVLSDRWRFTAWGHFRDEGCDEAREARGWKKERLLTVILLVLMINVLFGIFLFVGG